jgi:hypothetical protein
VVRLFNPFQTIHFHAILWMAGLAEDARSRRAGHAAHASRQSTVPPSSTQSGERTAPETTMGSRGWNQLGEEEEHDGEAGVLGMQDYAQPGADVRPAAADSQELLHDTRPATRTTTAKGDNDGGSGGSDHIELEERSRAGGGRGSAASADDKTGSDVTQAAVPDDAGGKNTWIAVEDVAQNVPREYKVYRRRWFGLVQLTLLNIIVSWGVRIPVSLSPAPSFCRELQYRCGNVRKSQLCQVQVVSSMLGFLHMGSPFELALTTSNSGSPLLRLQPAPQPTTPSTKRPSTGSRRVSCSPMSPQHRRRSTPCTVGQRCPSSPHLRSCS